VRSSGAEIVPDARQLTELAQDTRTIDFLIRAAERGGLVHSLQCVTEPPGATSRCAAPQDRIDFFVSRHLHEYRSGSARLSYLRGISLFK